MKSNSVLESLFQEISNIRQEGNIVIIKYDNEREDNFITVVVSNPKTQKNVRLDGDNLKELIEKVIEIYYQHEL